MAALETELMVTMQTWKNIDELEESINLDEATALITEMRRIKREDFKASAALQGIDLEDNEDSTFDEIKARAEMKAAGETNETQLEFAGVEGLGVEVLEF